LEQIGRANVEMCCGRSFQITTGQAQLKTSNFDVKHAQAADAKNCMHALVLGQFCASLLNQRAYKTAYLLNIMNRNRQVKIDLQLLVWQELHDQGDSAVFAAGIHLGILSKINFKSTIRHTTEKISSCAYVEKHEADKIDCLGHFHGL
jgi:hypothetical protein